MKNYEQVLETVELALAKGEYHFCIQFISPIIKSFPLDSQEGVNLRTILITALCGINKKENAKEICKELLKSHESKTRDDAKYLMEIINSPEIKRPENWNIKFDNNTSLKKNSRNALKLNKINLSEKKFINIVDKPTGETKPFQSGFAFIIFLILLLLIPLLSGCVKIENTLDLRQFESINNYLEVESKYINKLPWQIKFEDVIKDILPDAEIVKGESNFSLENKNLNLKDAKEILNKIQKTAFDLAGFSSDLSIDTTQRNLIFFKKYNFRISFDLEDISKMEDIQLNFKIIHPHKAKFTSLKNPQLKISKNLIIWNLIPGQINFLEFSFWSWNKLFIGSTVVLLLITITYFLRFYRLKLGSDLPQLPSE